MCGARPRSPFGGPDLHSNSTTQQSFGCCAGFHIFSPGVLFPFLTRLNLGALTLLQSISAAGMKTSALTPK